MFIFKKIIIIKYKYIKNNLKHFQDLLIFCIAKIKNLFREKINVNN